MYVDAVTRQPDDGADRVDHGTGRVPRVAAVVTAFRPGSSLPLVCESVVEQVDVLVVVDDDSPADDGSTQRLLDACRALGAHVVRHDANEGIGAALNTGTRRATELLDGEGYLLTLDQDSTVPPGYVASLVEAGRAAGRHGLRVGLVGPATVEGIGSMAARRTPAGDVVGDEPIQSGLLVPLAALDALGGFDEGLFIDGVDSDFYLRARASGWVTVVAPGTHLGHRLGADHEVGGVHLTHAAAFRYYYIARNRVLLLRRYARTAPAWCTRAVLKDLRHLAVTTLAVPGRGARWRATLAGLRDGVRGVTGRRPGLP